MKKTSVFFCLFGLACAANVSRAAVIYSQPYAYKPSQYGAISDAGRLQYLADNFILSGAASVRSVKWFGYWGIGQLVSGSDLGFKINIYTDTSAPSRPASLLSSQGVTATANLFGPVDSIHSNGMYELSAVLTTPVSLSAGVTYWISIYENQTGNEHFSWATASSGLIGYAWSTSLSTWSPVNSDSYGREYVAFELSDTVPEPSALSLLAVGLGGLVMIRHRRS